MSFYASESYVFSRDLRRILCVLLFPRQNETAGWDCTFIVSDGRAVKAANEVATIKVIKTILLNVEKAFRDVFRNYANQNLNDKSRFTSYDFRIVLSAIDHLIKQI